MLGFNSIRTNTFQMQYQTPKKDSKKSKERTQLCQRTYMN